MILHLQLQLCELVLGPSKALQLLLRTVCEMLSYALSFPRWVIARHSSGEDLACPCFNPS